jgi:hypothetical protein
MQHLVSTRWTRVSGLALSVAVALGFYAYSGSAWMAWMSLAWVILALSGAIWLVNRSSSRSVQQMLADLDGEPVRAVARVSSAAPTRTVL